MYPNTRRLVIALAIIVVLLIGVNIGKNLSNTQTSAGPTPTKGTPTPTPTPITQRIYANQTCGVTFTYPSNLVANESSQSGTQFTDPAQPKNAITLVCQRAIPRVPLPPDKIESMVIPSSTGSATVSAKLYHDTSAVNGTPVDKLIFTNRKYGLDVYIAGFGGIFNGIIDSLKLL